MNKLEKILLVALFGSIMGAVELFGGDLLRTIGISHRSSLLFALGIMLMLSSKRLIDFKGSIIIMAAIAAVFKTASASFYACQVAAMMINGIIFEGVYYFLKNKFETSIFWRSISALIIAYVSFAAFALTAAFLIREPHWATRGLLGVGEYLGIGALIAGILSIVTINLALYLGDLLKRLLSFNASGLAPVYFRTISIGLTVIIWIAGMRY